MSGALLGDPAARHDQAAGLRRLVAGRRTRPVVIAVAGAKGGVGKTVVAVGVALALAEAGRRVVLVDADLGAANADLHLGVPAAGPGLGEVLSGTARPEDALVLAGPEGSEILFCPGSVPVPGRSTEMGPERLREGLAAAVRALGSRGEICVVDTPAGSAGAFVAAATDPDTAVIVTTPEPPAVLEAYATAKALARAGIAGRLGIVVNQAGPAEAARTAGRLAEVARRFLGTTLESFGHVPPDPAVAAAVREGVPVLRAAPRSHAAHALRGLALALDPLGAGRASPTAAPVRGGRTEVPTNGGE
ncbi:MAG: P-loop NTPase [Planctomycetales bacterium]|nr:P-loop NTPase [Planctomycetales bacterium]